MIDAAKTLRLLGQRAPTRGAAAERAAEQAVRKGLPAHVVERLAKAFGTSSTEILSLLGLSRATGYRAKADPTRLLRAAQSDRAFRLARVFTLARDVFENEDDARDWFREPNRVLRGERPLDLLNTEAGTDRVVRLLNQIEYGVYS